MPGWTERVLGGWVDVGILLAGRLCMRLKVWHSLSWRTWFT